MPIRLTGDDRGFIVRVQSYCEAGLAEPQMAKREEMSLTSFRNRVFRCGFQVLKRVSRTVVRTGSGETFVQLMARGEVEVEESAGAA